MPRTTWLVLVVASAAANSGTDATSTTTPALSPYASLNANASLGRLPANATLKAAPPSQSVVFQAAETQADGSSAYQQEIAIYPYANLAGNSIFALLRFPFNQSLALATYAPLAPTPPVAGQRLNKSLPTSVETLDSSAKDFVINDISADTDTDTLFLATATGIHTYVDNYRHALQRLPAGWPTGLVTAVAGLVRVTLLGVNLCVANNVLANPLTTPFQEEAVAAVTYDPTAIAVTVKGLTCTSLTVTDARPAGLPAYVATVTCVMVRPGAAFSPSPLPRSHPSPLPLPHSHRCSQVRWTSPASAAGTSSSPWLIRARPGDKKTSPSICLSYACTNPSVNPCIHQSIHASIYSHLPHRPFFTFPFSLLPSPIPLSGARNHLQPFTTNAAMDAARVAAGGRPFLLSATSAALPFYPQMVVVRSSSGGGSSSSGGSSSDSSSTATPATAATTATAATARTKWLYWANLDPSSGLTTLYSSDVTGLNPSPVLTGLPAFTQFTYLTLPVATYLAATGGAAAQAQVTAATSIAARVGRKQKVAEAPDTAAPSTTAPATSPAATGATADVMFLVSGARGGCLSVYLNPASLSAPLDTTTAAALAALTAAAAAVETHATNATNATSTTATPLLVNIATAGRPTAVSADPDLANGYIFVALLDGRVLRVALAPLLSLRAAAALGLAPAPALDLAAGPLPAWAVFITGARTTARQGYVYSLPSLPATATATASAWGGAVPAVAADAVLQTLTRPREWTQMRVVTVDTNRHVLEVFADRGGPVQVDKITGLPSPNTSHSQVTHYLSRRGGDYFLWILHTAPHPTVPYSLPQIDLYRAGIVWPRALYSWQSITAIQRTMISCIAALGTTASATDAGVITDGACGGAVGAGSNVTLTEQAVTMHVYVAETFGKVWRLDLTRDANGYMTSSAANLAPVLVVDQSQFPASQRLRGVLTGLMAGRATSEQPPLSFELL